MRTLPVAALRAAGAASAAALLAFGASSAHAQARPDAPPAPKQVAPPTSKGVNWNAWGGDGGAQKYSPLADINRTNVKDLKVAWTWDANEQLIPASDGQKPARPGQFQATPLAINDTLIFSTPYNRVIAMEAMTGRQYWAFDPEPWKGYGQPSNGTGLVHRGVATWTDGKQRRVFINSRWRLFALDAKDGKPIPTFGANGEIDLTAGLSRSIRKEHYTNTSPPLVWGNLVILGNGVGDRLQYRGDPPGDIQAFDVRTGKRVWRFKTVPEAGEFGNDTWKDDSWKYVGHTNAWAPLSADDARGIVYVPVGTPSNDYWGGERKGAGLFGEAVVALDARTGKRVWHFQTAHHGLWDYDPPTAPVLLTVTQGGKKRDIVAAATKQGFLFVFDRVTGKPIWPIEERAVPQSDVPGEESSPTQPFPTKPAPFSPQGFTADDVADFTPEIRQAALAAIAPFRLGPLFTPPSMQGTIVRPGVIGGAGWGGVAIDRETGWAYIKASHDPAVMAIAKRDAPSDTIDAPYAVDNSRRALAVRLPVTGEGTAGGAGGAPGGGRGGGRGSSIPIIKPPYGTLTAIDLNTGDTKWTIPFGDTPDVRTNPALAGVKLPEKLGVVGSPGGMVTKGGLVFLTGGGRVLYAIDSKTGEYKWEHDLGQVAYSNPMTFRSKAGKQYVIIATGAATTSKLVAFALP
jgi:quinoprotein glucose dehydrogenase